MKTIRKRVISFILVFTVLAEIMALLPKNVQAEESKFVIQKGVLVKYNGSDKNVTIPKNVKSIKWRAFSECGSLQSVTIPGSVKKIGDYAFSSCPNLKKVVMKNGVTTIMYRSFENCKKLKSIAIPKSVKKIEPTAFNGTPWATRKIKQQKDKLLIVNHILLSGEKAKGKVTIPKGVTVIADNAFYNTKVTGITIPSTVKTIGESAFMLTNIKKVSFPKSVRSIGEGALFRCFKLKEVTILNSKAKVMWGKKGYYGGTIFDGPGSGLAGKKIVIKGYKNSTAQKLAKYMKDTKNNAMKNSFWDYVRYENVVFKAVKR